MRDPRMKIYEIAYRVGFQSDKYFSRVFKQVTGKSPSEYRQDLE
jgi:two-component system response regulator YesN